MPYPFLPPLYRLLYKAITTPRPPSSRPRPDATPFWIAPPVDWATPEVLVPLALLEPVLVGLDALSPVAVEPLEAVDLEDLDLVVAVDASPEALLVAAEPPVVAAVVSEANVVLATLADTAEVDATAVEAALATALEDEPDPAKTFMIY